MKPRQVGQDLNVEKCLPGTPNGKGRKAPRIMVQTPKAEQGLEVGEGFLGLKAWKSLPLPLRCPKWPETLRFAEVIPDSPPNPNSLRFAEV